MTFSLLGGRVRAFDLPAAKHLRIHITSLAARLQQRAPPPAAAPAAQGASVHAAAAAPAAAVGAVCVSSAGGSQAGAGAAAAPLPQLPDTGQYLAAANALMLLVTRLEVRSVGR